MEFWGLRTRIGKAASSSLLLSNACASRPKERDRMHLTLCHYVANFLRREFIIMEIKQKCFLEASAIARG